VERWDGGTVEPRRHDATHRVGEVGDQVVPVLGLLEAGKGHLGAYGCDVSGVFMLIELIEVSDLVRVRRQRGDRRSDQYRDRRALSGRDSAPSTHPMPSSTTISKTILITSHANHTKPNQEKPGCADSSQTPLPTHQECTSWGSRGTRTASRCPSERPC
jgi:hypothetical protein